VKALELSLAAPQVVALRSLMLLSSSAGRAGTAQEVVRMSTEKVQAWQESITAMTLQMQRAQQEWALAAVRQWWSAWTVPWQMTASRAGPRPLEMERAISRIVHDGLAPVHRRATANAKRLSRRKR
jgi:hypothetical protein